MMRDYALTQPDGSLTTTTLASPRWFRPRVDAATLRPLMQKQNLRPALDTALWFVLLGFFGGLAAMLWPGWGSLPFWLAYGVLYGSAPDARWHECGHQTAFRSAWANTVVYHIASFMLIRNPYTWRASHVRHHTDTIIPGRDPEIQLMRPPDLMRLAFNVVGVPDLMASVSRMLLHARGRLHPDEASYTRAADVPKVFRVARIWLGIYVGVIFVAVYWGSILPVLLVGGPRIYGHWHMVMTGSLQHLGLAENVTDHRLNTRTVLMNPLSRFVYLNMNYHVEHHMFTMVPYYHLPALHALIAHDLPRPEPSVPAAFARMLPVLWRQLKNENAVIVPELPPGATPYGPEVDVLRRHAV